MKHARRDFNGVLKIAIVFAVLIASIVVGQHLVLHEFHEQDHESTGTPPTTHEHQLMTPASTALAQTLVAAASAVAAVAYVLLPSHQATTAAPRTARDFLHVGALRAGPHLSLQPLLSTYLI